MTTTPTPTRYADPASVKLPAWVPATDASRDPLLAQFVEDATRWVKSATGRAWMPPAAPVTLTYDAPLSSILLTADFADVTGIVVHQNGVTVDSANYVWVWRTIDGDYPHAYALRLLAGTWADSANTAGRSPLGDVTLPNALPSTTRTPPGPIVQATQRKTLEYYLEWRASFQRLSTGSEDIGVQPAATIDAESVLGPFIHPRRLLGRP